MLRLGLLIVALSLAGLSARAQAPSDATIEELLQVSHAENMLQTMQGQMDTMMKDMMHKVAPSELTAAQQRAMDRFVERYAELMQSTMSWDAFKPLYIRLYRETFTQQEADGILTFYKSPTGQAMLNKLPTLMNKLMAEMPALMAPMIDKLKVLRQELTDDLKAAANPSSN